MIRLDVCRDFYLYQRRLAQNPNTVSYFFNLPGYTYQYHNIGGEIFGAVFDKCNKFQAYIPKLELN